MVFLTIFFLSGGMRLRLCLLALSSVCGLALAVLTHIGSSPIAGLIQDRAMSVNWVGELFEKGIQAPSIIDLQSQPVPKLSAETILGTGLISRKNGENASGNDSGYVQTYYALGLVMAVSFYSALLALLADSLLRRPDWCLMGFLTLGLLLIELKEPFVFKYIYPFVILTMLQMGMANKRNIPGRAIWTENQ
jgi:hypothetical protein